MRDGAGPVDEDAIELGASVYRGNWDAAVVDRHPVASYRWRLCATAGCSVELDSGETTSTAVEAAGLQLHQDERVRLCVVAVDDGGRRSTERCSDGAWMVASETPALLGGSKGAVAASAGSPAARLAVGPTTISTSTTWTRAGGPYFVSGRVYVQGSAIGGPLDVQRSVLTIEPGTVVDFAPGASLVIGFLGDLVVDGSEGDPVVFECATGAGGCAFGGSARVEAEQGARVRVAGLEYRWLSAMQIGASDARIVDSSFHHNAGALVVRADRLLVQDTEVTANTDSGIEVHPIGSVRVEGSTIVGNGGNGIRLWVATGTSGCSTLQPAVTAGCPVGWVSTQSSLVDNTITDGEANNVSVIYSDGLDAADGIIENFPTANGNRFASRPADGGVAITAAANVDEVRGLTSPSWGDNYWAKNPTPRYCLHGSDYTLSPLPGEGISVENPDFNGRRKLTMTPEYARPSAACSQPLDWEVGQDAVATYPVVPSLFEQVDWDDPSYAGPSGRGEHGAKSFTEALDPVNTLTGSLTYERNELEQAVDQALLPTTMTYNSRQLEPGQFGVGWSWMLDTHLALDAGTATLRDAGTATLRDAGTATLRDAGTATLRDADGAGYVFRRTPSGLWVSSHGRTWSSLVATDDGYRVTTRDGVRYEFDEEGDLLSRLDELGNGFAVVDVPLTGLRLVVLTNGRTLTLEVEAGRVAKITLDDGRSVGFRYAGESSSELERVVGLDGGVSHLVFTRFRQLACVTDPRGELVFENEYDARGRVARQWGATRKACSLTRPADAVADATSSSLAYGWNATHTVYGTTVTDPANAVWRHTYNESGQLMSRTDPTGRCTSYGYDSRDNRVLEVSPAGLVTTSTYDARGRVLSRRLSRATFSTPWNCAGTVPLPAASRLDEPVTERWEYVGAAGDVSRWTRTYDGVASPSAELRNTWVEGKLVETTEVGETGTADPGEDTSSSTVRFTRDDEGRPMTVTDARGGVWKYGWSAEGQLESETPPGRAATLYERDERGLLLRIRQPRGSIEHPDYVTWRFEHDAGGRLTARIDPYGERTGFAYDAAGHLVREVDALGRVTRHRYNAFGERVETTGPSGYRETYEYGEGRGLVTAHQVNAARTTYTYDDAGRLTGVVEPRGNVAGAAADSFRWTYGYDAAGRRNLVRGPEGVRVEAEFDLLDRETLVRHQVVQGAFTTTRFNDATTYNDAARSVVTTRREGGATTGGLASTAWSDRAGRMVRSADERGGTTRYRYDLAGNLTRTISAGGRVDGTEYAPDGSVIATVSPRGFEDPARPGQSVTDPFAFDPLRYATYRTAFELDPASGRQLGTIEPGGRRTETELDRLGRVRATTNAAGERTEQDFDPLGRVVAVTGPDGARTAYEWDDVARRMTMTDPRGGETTYVHDTDGRVVSKQLPSGRTWRYGYFVDGLTASVETPDGVASVPDANDGITRYAWDPLGRPRSIDYSEAATPDVSWSRDDAAGTTTMVDGLGSEVRSEDSFGRIISVARSGHQTLRYSWDGEDLPQSVSVDEGSSTQWLSDADGFVIRTIGSSTVASYDRDLAGNVIRMSTPFMSQDFAFDPNDEVTSVTMRSDSVVRSQYQVARDGVGRVTRIDGFGSTFASNRFAYDDAGRLARECVDTGATGCNDGASSWTTYRYDPSGNRVAIDRSVGADTALRYDDDDVLVAMRTGTAPEQRLTYDARGNLVNSATARYWYDQAGGVVGMGAPGAAAASRVFRNDGSGRRREQTEVATTYTRRYLWDDVTSDTPELVQEREVGGAGAASSFSHGPLGVQFGSIPALGVVAYQTDPVIGSVGYVTRAGTGTVLGSHQFDAFGNLSAASGTPLAQPYRFAGERIDEGIGAVAGNGTYHLLAREYDPASGVFNRRDPLERGVGAPHMGSYAYAEQNPTTFTDPLGLKAKPCGPRDPTTCAATSELLDISGMVTAAGSAAVCVFHRCISDPLEDLGDVLPPRPYVPELDGGDWVPGLDVSGEAIPSLRDFGICMGKPATSAVVAFCTSIGLEATGPQVHMMEGRRASASTPSTSPIWKSLTPLRGKTRTNGMKGRKRRCYEWDYTHGDIEEYDRGGNHLGSIDPHTGARTKGPSDTHKKVPC